jgi:hypothetical protein
MEDNAMYLSRRARAEREAAAAAVHPIVRQRHNELADAYEQRIRALYAEQDLPPMRLVSTG